MPQIVLTKTGYIFNFKGHYLNGKNTVCYSKLLFFVLNTDIRVVSGLKRDVKSNLLFQVREFSCVSQQVIYVFVFKYVIKSTINVHVCYLFWTRFITIYQIIFRRIPIKYMYVDKNEH